MHGHFNLPPFGIIEKMRTKIKRKEGVCTTTSWVMVKNQPVIHLSIGTVMRLAILNHAQKTRSNNEAKQCKLQNQSTSKGTKASQRYSQTES